MELSKSDTVVIKWNTILFILGPLVGQQDDYSALSGIPFLIHDAV